VTGRWFSPGTPVPPTKKTNHHDITEIFLKVALNTMTLTLHNCELLLDKKSRIIAKIYPTIIFRLNYYDRFYFYFYQTLLAFNKLTIISQAARDNWKKVKPIYSIW
jgi:hypothetical protein